MALVGTKVKVLECRPDEEGSKLTCVFSIDGAKVSVVAGVRDNGSPQLIEKTADKPVDPKLMEEAVGYTLRSIKLKKGEFVAE